MGIKAGRCIVLLNFFTSLVACHPGCDVSHSDLTGGIDSVQPNKDSLRIGDTLYYTAKVPYKLASTNGFNMVDFSGASNVITEVDINYVLDLQKGVPSFSYFPIAGSYSIPTDSTKIEIKYVANDSSYDFRLGIVCKKRGIYFLNGLYIASAERKCATANIDVLMSVEDPHFHYFYDVRPNQPLSSIEETHLYAFEVN